MLAKKKGGDLGISTGCHFTHVSTSVARGCKVSFSLQKENKIVDLAVDPALEGICSIGVFPSRVL